MSTSLPPYVIVGVALWACVLASGLHPTLAGVILALFIPTRPPPNLTALTTQANAIITAEAMRGRRSAAAWAVRRRRCAPSMRSTTGSNRRPTACLRNAGARSSYLVLPLFALANAGVALRAARSAAASG